MKIFVNVFEGNTERRISQIATSYIQGGLISNIIYYTFTNQVLLQVFHNISADLIF